MDDALKRLDKLTHGEPPMALILESMGIVERWRCSILVTAPTIYDIRGWLSPPDPSTNHNIACSTRHQGTAEWFFKAVSLQNGNPLVRFCGFTGSVRTSYYYPFTLTNVHLS